MAALSWGGWVSVQTVTDLSNTLYRNVEIGTLTAVILLPLRPASLTHKNPQRHKIIRGTQRTIDRFEDSFLVEYPVGVISVAVL